MTLPFLHHSLRYRLLIDDFKEYFESEISFKYYSYPFVYWGIINMFLHSWKEWTCKNFTADCSTFRALPFPIAIASAIPSILQLP